MSARDRTFQARDMLWTMFEQMAHEQDVPVDNLVNEAMKAYANARGYTAPPPRRNDPLEETRDRPSASAMVDAYADDELGATQARRMDVRAMLNQPPSHTPSGGARQIAPPPQMRTAPAPSRPVRPAAGMPPAIAPPPRSMAEPTLRSRPPPLPPPPMGGGPPHTQRIPNMPGGGGRDSRDRDRDRGPSLSAKQLVLTYRGRPSTVDKDRYLIGRSKTQADLRLDDPNVSRQHVAIERVGSAWYVVDLGSTNGVFVSGERVNRRALVDGDIIVITTHEIRCSLQ